MKKLKIATSDGIAEVLQQGDIRRIGDYYYFAAMYRGCQRISELSTGFALPKGSSFEEAEKFLKQQPEGKIDQVIGLAKKIMEAQGIQYPLNYKAVFTSPKTSVIKEAQDD